MRTKPMRLAAAMLLAALAGSTYAQPADEPGALKLEINGATAAKIGYFPVQVQLADERPAAVTREPSYGAKPKYATIKLGNGPKNTYVLALDEPADAAWRIFVDVNRNGDLTDDGDGSWSKKTDANGRIMYGVNTYALRASYGTESEETSASDYGVAFYRFSSLPHLLMYRTSARVGVVEIGGKRHKAMLVENDGDGLFLKRVTKAEDAPKTRPLWLRLDTSDDGKFATTLDIRAPFKLGETAYEAIVADDGTSLKLVQTDKPVLDLAPKAPPRPPLLAAGTPAPDFVVEKWGGGSLKLSDYRGKIVVLDFWATWCGPCQRSMPHMEQIHKATSSQGVVVLGVCVWDEAKAYTEWVPKNLDKYSFQFAFDPAGRGPDSIARKLYNVSGIPTSYVIDKDGKVAAGIVGYQDGDKRIEDALAALGVKL